MGNDASILDQTADYVFRLFREHGIDWCLYHNYAHTVETVETCREIACGMAVSEKETEVLLVAAWFHDTGCTFGLDGHEEKSAELAREFLMEKGYSREYTDLVCRCIFATKLPQHPESLLEEILCDADLSHLGKPDYREKSELIRIEIETQGKRTFTDIEWIELNIGFFLNNPFHTKYANLTFNAERQKNLVDLYQRLRKKTAKDEGAEKTDEHGENPKKQKKDKSVQERGLERNMEVYYRTSSRNHVDFSAIVDHKANIMIQTNSLIFSIIISLLVRKLDEFPQLMLPTFVLLLSCVATIITSVLATRPKITRTKTTKESIRERKANLLFFGTFINLKLDEFEWGMKEMLKDKDYYIDNMIRDTYFLGKVLNYKYRFLRISYDIFMLGLLASILLYSFAFIKWP
ncbi:MAG: HD domain-containing protein [Chlorobiaceae bacterium]|nr:HD domain-containing protein [Chlorobiaceae bacterium]NTV61108.1 HD domain-containing protein [Chlorobiaceae bacterium]